MSVIEIPLLSNEQAASIIQQEHGYIPINVDPQDGEHRIIWLNVGDYQFTESKFRYSIQRLTAEPQSHERFATDIRLLESVEFLQDTLYPSGFIFHMSRCGSTLLAKAMARVPEHIVIDEGTPLNDGLWHYFTNGWQSPVAMRQENLTLFRNMVFALGRRRTAEQQTYFVKLRSWNVIFIDFIMRAFPDVPCLFIYREPEEVIVSGLMRPVWIMDFKGLPQGGFLTGTSPAATAAMSTLDYMTLFYECYLQAALSVDSDRLQYLNYEDIKVQNLVSILQRSFQYTITPAMLEQMAVQFTYYSKDDSDTIHFSSDREEKQSAVTAEIRQAVARELASCYQKLNQSPHNLYHG